MKQGDNFYKRSFTISNLTGVKTNYSLTVFGSDVTLPKNISGTSSTIEDIGIIFDINCYYTDFNASKPRISKFNVSVQFNDINNSTQYTLSKTYEIDCTRSKIEFFGLLDPKTNSVIPVIKGDPLRLDGIITGNIFPVSSGVSAVNVSITSPPKITPTRL
ncbi:hypothetical protein [Deinococcus sp.]|uniref:hypothetical protein n=1 Tax=Deinococcus sp. TaxID=47478 RepID=UPI003C7BB19A